MTATQLRLMDFYQVDTLDKLIEKQAEHIVSLQKKLADITNACTTFKPQRVK